jgi:tyrosinase
MKCNPKEQPMADPAPPDQVVDNPTYMGDIRFFFEQMDIDHMKSRNIDLSTYDGVKKHAGAIYVQTAPPHPNMPPEKDRQWSAARSLTFKNWILAGYPVGTAVAQTGPAMAAAAAATRVRKNVTKLSQPEVDKLKAAFTGIMQKGTSDAQSYYALASIHGLPQSYCLHHVDPFNPWHRVYLKLFEDALRSVPGCADVTLPYWDITTPIPALLQTAPFDSYVVPVPLQNGYPNNYKTQRYAQSQIDTLLARYDVIGHLDAALTQSQWGAYGIGGFQDESIAAHDGGHAATGPTMADQNVSSYDPIFWFYHCNLDRHWWSWQTNVGATTLAGFTSTLQGNTDWLSGPINVMAPFTATPDQSIAYGDVSYDQLMGGPVAVAFENKVGSLEATRAFRIRRTSKASVMVKDINRLNIPGSFSVVLQADGQPIATRAFFQPNTPRNCATCVKVGIVSVNFKVDLDKIVDKKLSVAIEVPGLADPVKTFPLSEAGNPTINVRLLLEDA